LQINYFAYDSPMGVFHSVTRVLCNSRSGGLLQLRDI
jgi:hypothetical protein